MRRHRWISALVLAFAGVVTAENRVPWTQVPEPEQRLVRNHLDSEHWPYRVFALLRLEHYTGDAVAELVRARASDEAWQVRCFAWREAQRMDVTLAPALLDEERDPHVIRAALRHGGVVEGDRVVAGARRLLRTRGLDDLMLGIEIAAASDVSDLRQEAAKRVARLVAKMDESVAVRIGHRLGRVLGVAPVPASADAWRLWLADQPSPLPLAPTGGRALLAPTPTPATLDAESFSRLLDYVDGLRQRDLDVVIVMDFTMSMLPMINETRAGVESLILFLNDIARRVQVAIVAYRDHDNPPVWEGHPFTSDIDAVRDFLFKLEITGGRDLPEAVLNGLAACGELDWNPRAQRQIVLVGDARPHDADEEALSTLLERIRDAGTIVHTVHVPQRPNEEFLATVSRFRQETYRAEIAEHNRRTEIVFGEIATRGAGQAIELREAEALVPSIMKFTIEEGWWDAFDEFYGLYVELCR